MREKTPRRFQASGPAPGFENRSTAVGFIGYLISLVVVGFIIGGLGRLIVPGPNPIGLWKTLGVGLAGALVGGLVGSILGLGAFSIILELAVSAGLVYFVSGGRRSLYSGRR
jgi:uncharacterized membrane protein YeaQ/YmgE (transglycosylase-associated protein family)